MNLIQNDGLKKIPFIIYLNWTLGFGFWEFQYILETLAEAFS